MTTTTTTINDDQMICYSCWSFYALTTNFCAACGKPLERYTAIDRVRHAMCRSVSLKLLDEAIVIAGERAKAKFAEAQSAAHTAAGGFVIASVIMLCISLYSLAVGHKVAGTFDVWNLSDAIFSALIAWRVARMSLAWMITGVAYMLVCVWFQMQHNPHNLPILKGIWILATLRAIVLRHDYRSLQKKVEDAQASSARQKQQ
jgi:hypothetical protein